jgi:hypothetical protein
MDEAHRWLLEKLQRLEQHCQEHHDVYERQAESGTRTIEGYADYCAGAAAAYDGMLRRLQIILQEETQ